MTAPPLDRTAPVPDGREIRRITAAIQGAREGRGAGAFLLELWYAAMTLGVAVAMVVGAATTLHDARAGVVGDAAARAASTPPGPLVAGGDLAAALALVAVLAGLLAAAGRLGPVSVGGGGGAWWLPMPVERRGLLRPVVLAWPGVGAVAGTVAVPLGTLVLGLPATPGRLLAWAAVGGAAGAATVAWAALRQARATGDPSHTTAATGDRVLLVAVAGLTALAVARPGTAGAPGTPGTPGTDDGALLLPGAGEAAVAALGLLGLAGAVVLTRTAARRAGAIPGARLRAHGSIGDRARAAVLSLDLRELGRTLTLHGRPPRRTLRRARPGAVRALLTADLLLLARTPRALVQAGLAALLAVAATRTDLPHPLLVHLALLVTGFWAANAAAGGARHAQVAPAVDRLLPLPPRVVRLVRGGAPLLVALPWSLAALGAVGAAAADARWLALAPAWAVVLAAAAVRSGYRPDETYVTRAVATPVGSAPPVAGFTKGVDVVLAGTLPTAVGLVLGRLPDAVLVAQAVVAAVVVATCLAVVGQDLTGRRRR